MIDFVAYQREDGLWVVKNNNGAHTHDRFVLKEHAIIDQNTLNEFMICNRNSENGVMKRKVWRAVKAIMRERGRVL